jgi:DNA-binding CsgD family transcriptional regulator
VICTGNTRLTTVCIRQAGERLFMSRFTVDSHLRSIYRKLGVASRFELAWAISASASGAV